VALALLADEMMVFICLVLSRGLGMIDSIQKQFFFSSGKPYLMVMKQAQHPNLFFFLILISIIFKQVLSLPLIIWLVTSRVSRVESISKFA
jgi:hypothetical protein